MADIPASNWNEADASNSTAAPDGWPEGMAPSGVNDSGRAMMGAVKRWYDWTIPLVTGGTSTAYTLAYSVAPGALVDGMTHLVQFNAVNGAAPTLNVNALGAKPLHFYAGGAWGAFPANMVAVDQVVRVTYNAAAGTYRAIGLPMVLTQSVSGVTVVDFTGIPTNVNNLNCFFSLNPSASGMVFGLRVYGTGGSLDTTGANYFAINISANGSAVTPTAFATSIPLNVNTVDTGNVGFKGDLSASNIQAAEATAFNFRAAFVSAGSGNMITGTGTHVVAANITGVRFYIIGGAGTFSGKITLMGTG